MLTALTPRKRFNRAMRFQSVDRIPLLHMGVWRETAERWQKEGMLSETQEFAAFDGPMQSCWLYGKFQGLLPAFGEIKLACESGSLECVPDDLFFGQFHHLYIAHRFGFDSDCYFGDGDCR